MTDERSPAIDFAVALLETDGLIVPPFDAHPRANGPLQRAGLGPELWARWIGKLLDLERELAVSAARLESPLRRSPAMAEFTRQVERREQPWLSLPGPAALRAAVASAWQAYLPAATVWFDAEARKSAVRRLPPGGYRRLTEGLAAAGQAPIVRVFPVRYAAPVAMAWPPDAVIVGLGGRDLGSEQVVAEILRAISNRRQATDGGRRSNGARRE